MIWNYRLLVVPAALLSLPILAILNSKVRKGLALRLKPLPKFKFQHPPIWIHAASGEFEYAKAVIREIKHRHPEQAIAVSYFSPSFAKAVERFEGVDVSFPLPLDLPGPLATLLRRLRPKALLISRTDLWPELMTQSQRFSVPVYLFSYTQKRMWGFQSWLRRQLLNQCAHVFCVSSDDADELKTLGVRSRVSVLGDTRYDQVCYRLQNPKALPAQMRPALPAMVAGSTWKEDEEVLLPALAPLLKNSTLQLILVPHEPTASHLAETETLCRKLGLTTARYSEGASWVDKQVLLVDQTGILAELYLWGEMAFVGGSFRKSVHSVMEPLGAGLRTWVGPFHLNNREAQEFSQIGPEHCRLVTIVRSQQEILASVDAFLKDSQLRFECQQTLKQEFTKRQGASRALVNELVGL